MKLKCNMCDGLYQDELDVRFGMICDNACPFCFNKIGRPAQKFNLEKVIQSALEEAPRSCINIVGGEPLLSCMLDDLLTFIKAVRHTTQKLCIISSLPPIPKNKQKVFEEIMELTDELIISLQHYNDDKNSELMNATHKYSRMAKIKELKESRFSDKISITLNISLNGINTAGKLNKALQIFDEMGIKYVRINELGNTPLHISIRQVVPDYKFKSPFAHGCSIDLTKHFKKKLGLKNIQTIKTRIRCFIVEPTEKASFADLIKTWIQRISYDRSVKNNAPLKYGKNRPTVIYEDGHKDWSWAVYEINR